MGLRHHSGIVTPDPQGRSARLGAAAAAMSPAARSGPAVRGSALSEHLDFSNTSRCLGLSLGKQQAVPWNTNYAAEVACITQLMSTTPPERLIFNSGNLIVLLAADHK